MTYRFNTRHLSSQQNAIIDRKEENERIRKEEDERIKREEELKEEKEKKEVNE